MNWELLGRAPIVITTVTSISVLLSVIHEWGYFTALEGEWRSNLLIKDYAVLAVEWLPAAAIVTVLELIVANKFTSFIKTRMAKGSDGLPLKDLFILNPWIMFPPFAASVFFAYLIADSGIWIVGIFWVAGYIWLILGYRVMVPQLKVRGVKSHEMLLVVLPPLLAMIFSLGFVRAYFAINSAKETYTVTMKGDAGSRRVSILKSIERGILVRDAELMKNELLVWSEIISVAFDAKDQKHQRPICRFLTLKICDSNPDAHHNPQEGTTPNDDSAANSRVMSGSGENNSD